MDHIIGLALSTGNSVIMVAIVRLTKFAHFCTLSPTLMQLKHLISIVVKIYGFPKNMASDRDSFLSKVWQSLILHSLEQPLDVAPHISSGLMSNLKF